MEAIIVMGLAWSIGLGSIVISIFMLLGIIHAATIKSGRKD